jgi:hypothetical protein
MAPAMFIDRHGGEETADISVQTKTGTIVAERVNKHSNHGLI